MEHKGTKKLETSRLILRPFRQGDAELMFKNWASDPAVTYFLTWPTHESVETTKAIVDSWIERYGDPSYYNWAIEYKGFNGPIGNISVVHSNDRNEWAEIGYCLGKKWWGKGIMPEALGEVIAYLFDVAGFNRICAYHDYNNPKSGRVMVKAGMKYEGTMRQAAKNKFGEFYDLVGYSILRDEA